MNTVSDLASFVVRGVGAIVLAALSGYVTAQPTPGWCAGDTHVHTAIHAVSSISQRVEEARTGGLDWVAITRHVRSGILHKAAEVDSAYSRHYPTVAPLLGLEWDEPPELGGEDIVLLGVNRYAPVPDKTLQDIIDYANREDGVFIFAHPSSFVFDNLHKWKNYTAFEGYSGTRWNDACTPGGAWDRLLTNGGTLFIVGASDNHNDAFLGEKIVKTYVHAPSNRPTDIVAGIRAGRVYVAERDQIRMSFSVNGHDMGDRVSTQGGTVRIAISATGKSDIRRILLIGNGQILSTHFPESPRFFMEQTLSIPPTLRYLRVIAETADAKTMSNPVFLMQEGTNGKNETAPAAVHPLSPARRLAASAPDARQDVQALLTPWLDDPDPQKRMQAVYGMLDLGLPNARKSVRVLCADTTTVVRRYAARMLAGFAVPGDLALIRRLIADADAEIRLWGVRALETAGVRQGRSLLLDLLEDPAYWVHYAAMEALVEASSADPSVFDELERRVEAGKLGAAETFRWASPSRRQKIVGKFEARYLKTPTEPLFATLAALFASPSLKVTSDVRRALSPMVDGRIDDTAWQAGNDLALTPDVPGSTASAGRARVAYVGDTLFVAVTCTAAPPMPYSDAVEVVLIGLDTNRNGSIDYTFEIDRTGKVHGRKDGLTDWNAPIRVQTTPHSSGWVAEIAIPFSSVRYSIPVAGQTWGFNVFHGFRGVTRPAFAWSPTFGRLEDARRYGHLTFEK
ncbi:MAG: CehA/McbA family metallohydrolase [candidate division Zixibacteria bacterium]|nr:CehA/McbA family metallohydrolase [candidate division Zixibacteria bacterium]